MILLDFTPDVELQKMATCREVTSRIQKLCKEANLKPDDPVQLVLSTENNSLANVLMEKQVYVDGLLRRNLTILGSSSNGVQNFEHDFLKKRQIIARDDVTLNEKEGDKLHKKIDFVVVILAKQPQFLPAFDTISESAEERDILKKAVMSYGYSELTKHFTANSRLNIAVNTNPKTNDSIKSFDIHVGTHLVLN